MRQAVWKNAPCGRRPAPKMSPAFAAVFRRELADAAVLCDEGGTPVEVGLQGEGELEVAQLAPPQVASHGGARPQTKSFAAETAAITGESKSQVNRHVAHAEALGDDIDRLTGTSLDKGVEIDALAKLPEPEPDPRKPLAWLIDELGLPVGAEALRLRAKAEGWAKPVGMVGKEQSKVGKPKHEKDGPSLDHDDFELIRTTWETDPREDYAWLVEAMGLDVSAPAVRKTAMRDGWTKCGPAVAAPAKDKVSQPPKVSKRNHQRNHARNHGGLWC